MRRVGGLLRRMGAFALVELQKLSHDRSELVTRMVQPALWLLIFGQTFSRLHVIDTGDVPYLAFLAPGIIAQSALFISIFYGIQIVWDRDAGILAKLMVTPGARVGAHHRQGVRGGRAVGRAGGRRAGDRLPDGHPPDRQPAADPRRRWPSWCSGRRSSRACR